MTIFQCQDSLERRKYIESKGIRALNSFGNIKHGNYIINQYHPKDLPGALVEIDSVTNTNYKEKYADWPPALREDLPILGFQIKHLENHGRQELI